MRFCRHSFFLLVLTVCPLPSHAIELLSPAVASSAVPAVNVEKPAQDNAIYIQAESLEGKKDQGMEAHGKVELRQGQEKVLADHLYYQQQTGDISAQGSVRLDQAGGVISGPDLQMNLDTHVGQMSKPTFEFKENKARGSAEKMQSTDKLNYSFDNAVYTTCPDGNDDWLLKMSRLEIDRSAQVGTAHNALVEFKGAPILYAPWLDFPLDGRRRSGFLGPTFGVTNAGGAEFTLPYYWNMAANYDATITPRKITNRGVLVNEEFRYLGAGYLGEIHYDVLPHDHLVDLRRTHSSFLHTQNLGYGFGAKINLNRVSDDAYFRDLATTVVGGTQTQLPNEGILSYGGGGWTASVKAQTFQTLQDPLAPVAIPYQRLPQVNLAGQKSIGDTQLNIVNEFVDFRHPTLVNGQRTVVYPSVTYAILNDPGYFVKPRLGVHSTRYSLGDNNIDNVANTSRTLPIFSVDSGLVFDRDLFVFGKEFVQTLEPRVFYVRIPYVDQSSLPNFDTSQAPFSFAQMFTENRFFGNDRVGDANMVTTAVTSRLIDNTGGVERLRVAVGQRFSFDLPQVNLLPQDTYRRSDILLAVSGKVTNSLSLDGLLEYNPNTAHTQSYNGSARYRPETGKVLNLGYRYTRGDVPENDVRQADFSTQWPLFWRWYAVTRVSYSLQDRRVLEALGGLEYNQSCWMLRLVAQRFPTATQQVSTGIFVQLELNDLVALGADPLSALRTSIPGYSKLNANPNDKSSTGLR